jgi:protein PET100
MSLALVVSSTPNFTIHTISHYLTQQSLAYTNLQFGFYLLTPICVMYYVGLDTDAKFNLPGFWPDPSTLNQVPKEPHEIQAEVARIRRERADRRRRLEEKARELGIEEE